MQQFCATWVSFFIDVVSICDIYGRDCYYTEYNFFGLVGVVLVRGVDPRHRRRKLLKAGGAQEVVINFELLWAWQTRKSWGGTGPQCPPGSYAYARTAINKPPTQVSMGLNHLVIRTEGDPARLAAAVRSEVRRADPNFVIDSMCPCAASSTRSFIGLALAFYLTYRRGRNRRDRFAQLAFAQ